MVLVYTESEGGKFKKIAFEAVSYAKGIAEMMSTEVVAVSVNGGDTSELGTYGASKVLEVSDGSLDNFNVNVFAGIVAEAAKAENAQVVVMSSSANSKFMAPMVAVKLEAGYVPNATELPSGTSPFTVKHSVYTNISFFKYYYKHRGESHRTRKERLRS